MEIDPLQKSLTDGLRSAIDANIGNTITTFSYYVNTPENLTNPLLNPPVEEVTISVTFKRLRKGN